MSVICQNFVQNAWRKDLCSNCFKSEADHSDIEYKVPVDRGRYVPQATSVYQARVISPGIHWRPLLSDSVSRIHDPIIYDKIACRDFSSQTGNMDKTRLQNGMTLPSNNKGILKQKKTSKKPRRTSVGFAPEEPLIIGYGGNDYDSDENSWELGSDDGSINLELLDITDEDRTITKLTKNNTEFNSDNDNLKSSPIQRDTHKQVSNHNSKNGNDHNSKPSIHEHRKTGEDRNTTTKINNSGDNQERKLSYYYFSAKDEPPKYQIPISNHIDQVKYLNQCKEMSLITKDIPGIINNIQNNNKNNDESKVDHLNKINNLSTINDRLQEKCHRQSSSKYLLITKINDNGGGSSDSDYSTSKQTNGESSTDTDSFHDAEDTAITPCTSFLHGTPNCRNDRSQSNPNSFMIEQPFETSSVSSGDTSTLSDDSDCHANVRRSNKNKIHQNKAARQLQSNKSSSSHEFFVENNNAKSNVSNPYNEYNDRFKTDYDFNSDIRISTNIKNDFSDESHACLSGEKSIQVNIRPTSSSQDVNLTAESAIKETKKINTKEPVLESNKNGIKKEINCKTVRFSEVETNEEIPRQSPNRNNMPVEVKKSVNQSPTEISNGNPIQKMKDESSKHIKTKNSGIIIKHSPAGSQSNGQPAKVEEKNIYGKTKTSSENSQALANEVSHHDEVSNQAERQNMLTECKNVISNNEQWASLQRKNHSSPPATTTIDPNAIQTSPESCHLEKEQSDSNHSSAGSSPNSKLNRQNKLAALALELEKVRCDSKGKEVNTFQAPPPPPPEIPRYAPPKERNLGNFEKQGQSGDIKQTSAIPDTSANYPSIRRGKSLVSSSNISKMSSLPDLLPETTTTKLKKGRFSLKKLLKRGKDSDTLVINSSSEQNPKAWKRQIFDKSRLSLEIVHPMDMTSDSQTSNDSTPTEERNRHTIFTDPSGKTSKTSRHNSGALRARSLSALPQLTSCVFDTSDAVVANGLHRNTAIDDASASLDRTRLDMPRKAGTVAERSKKYKAPRRTPSFSELRTQTPTSGQNSATDGGNVERPQKPPPPPRGKVMPPPPPLPPTAPPPTQGKANKKNPSPVRPPPPKDMNGKEIGLSTRLTSTPNSSNLQDYFDGDYANLGDIRLHLTPKKPGRPSAISFARDSFEMDCQDLAQEDSTTNSNFHREEDNTYECLEVQEEEEDHYTYLDDPEGKLGKMKNGNPDVKIKSYQQKAINCQNGGDEPPQRPDNDDHLCSSHTNNTLKKPWLDLQASYAAIAAANYESLAEFITTAISDGLEKLQKTASTLKWNDFSLETETPIQTLEDKFVYNATYKIQPDIKVTLLLTTQKQHTAQSCRNPTKPSILASFSDHLPRKYIDLRHKQIVDTDEIKVMIYVLERSKATTVDQFAEDSSCYRTNQHIHLRNACFVLLQLIHTLKSLQADGIEEIDYNLGRILLLQTDVDKPPILVLLPGDKSYLTMTNFYNTDIPVRKTTLCQTTLQLLLHLLRIKDISQLNNCVVNGEFLAAPVAHTFRVISKVLSEEKASSLTQAKGLLEYMLWGPVDIRTTKNDTNDVDIILQRWLDLQRAQMVKSLISNLHLKINSHTGFHVYEEYQLIFLLQATVKSLRDIIMKL